MKPICKSIFFGLCLSALSLLPGCFPEGVDGCPEDMHLSFYLDDQYEDGTYDSRVANEVFMYVFQNQQLLTSFRVPYEGIESGKEYAYRKYDGFEGELELVAWAAAKDASDAEVPESGSSVELEPGENGSYKPASTDLYVGNESASEKVDETSHYKLRMGVGSCRVQVNILDYSGVLRNAGSRYAQVSGTMSQMTMLKTGSGSAAEVITKLNDVDGNGQKWETGKFGVLPSSEGQTVSVGIYADGSLLKTLEVPSESLPQGAQAGGYLIFEYTLGEAFYTLTIEGFTEMIQIVDEM